MKTKKCHHWQYPIGNTCPSGLQIYQRRGCCGNGGENG